MVPVKGQSGLLVFSFQVMAAVAIVSMNYVVLDYAINVNKQAHQRNLEFYERAISGYAVVSEGENGVTTDSELNSLLNQNCKLDSGMGIEAAKSDLWRQQYGDFSPPLENCKADIRQRFHTVSWTVGEGVVYYTAGGAAIR